jgi:uncharacterized C2H2 Zn-finger protein
MAAKKGRATVRCNTCGKVIRVPKDWSVGAATRRHYWRNHRDVMLAARKKNTR